MARPLKITELTVKKLEEAFILGATVKEACFYANISKQTYYNWTAKNSELLDRFVRLREAPILRARKCLVDSFKENPRLAMRYLEKRHRLNSEEANLYCNVNTKELADAILSKFEIPSN